MPRRNIELRVRQPLPDEGLQPPPAAAHHPRLSRRACVILVCFVGPLSVRADRLPDFSFGSTASFDGRSVLVCLTPDRHRESGHAGTPASCQQRPRAGAQGSVGDLVSIALAQRARPPPADLLLSGPQTAPDRADRRVRRPLPPRKKTISTLRRVSGKSRSAPPVG